MDSRHKNKAITGAAVWFGSIPLVFIVGAICKKFSHESAASSGKITGFIFLSFLFVQYLAFFWGGSHLAKAKGYSNGMLVFGIFWPAQLIIFPLLLFALPDKCTCPSNQVSRKKHSHDESLIAHIVRYRRNALVANGLGIAGVLLALVLVFIPLGLFQSWDNAKVAGILVFLPSYAAIIYGCWWWVKAKNWPDAVVFIGLMPLAVLMVPYVRLIYRVTPLLLPAGMVLMPIILLGIIAVLPDKSGMPKRKHWDRD
ncbi:MAG: hypothetical protein ACLPYZ_06535 [Limisphaerales bacterium]